MNEDLGQATASEKEITETPSPTDKLEGKQPEGSPLPGAENPESLEVKEEANPNTE
jgi:hypothetical protein